MVAQIETETTALIPEDLVAPLLKDLQLQAEGASLYERPKTLPELFSFLLGRLFPEAEGGDGALGQLSENERLYLFVVCLYVQQIVPKRSIPLHALPPILRECWVDGYEWVQRAFVYRYHSFPPVHDLLSLEDSFNQFCMQKLAARDRLASVLSLFSSASCVGIKGYLHEMMKNELNEQGRRNKRQRLQVPTSDEDLKRKQTEDNIFEAKLGQGSSPPVNAEELLDVMLPLLHDFLFTGKESYQRSLCNFLYRERREDPFYAMPALKHKHQLASTGTQEEQERITKKLSNTRDKRISRMGLSIGTRWRRRSCSFSWSTGWPMSLSDATPTQEAHLNLCAKNQQEGP